MSYWLSVLWEHPFLSLLCLYIAYRVLDNLKRVPRLSGLTGKHVLITGCDSGFGHKLAQDLDALGMQVFAACYTDTGESELKKKCSSRLKTLHLDVTKDDSIQKAFEFVKSNLKGKGLWALVNNAGVCSGMGPMEWLQREHYQQVMEVNVFGMVEMTRVFLPLLKRAKGRVVNTASVLGRFSLPGAVPYSISKYGVEAFSDGIRLELKAFGVKVCILEPGFHATNMTEPNLVGKAVRRLFKEAPREVQDEYGEEFLNQYVEKSVRLILGGVTSPGLQDVVDAYTHAVTSRYPRGRYAVGTDANLFWIPLSYMPAWLTDTLLGTAIRRNKPAAIRNRKYD